MVSLEKILAEFNGNEGASAQAVVDAGHALGIEFPLDYAKFLSVTDGGEAMIGETYVIFWAAGDLGEMNAAYQVAEYAPGLLLFGSDGAGEAFAFDKRATPWSVVQVPFVGMDLTCVESVAPSFSAFLKGLLR